MTTSQRKRIGKPARTRRRLPPKRPPALMPTPVGYGPWLAKLKADIRSAQLRASVSVNRELVLLYWRVGRDILERQAKSGWGSKVVDRLAHDLGVAFPEMKGFSPRNLKYMRAFAEAWPEAEFVQQAAAQLPWFHRPRHHQVRCAPAGAAIGSRPRDPQRALPVRPPRSQQRGAGARRRGRTDESPLALADRAGRRLPSRGACGAVHPV